MSAKDEIKQEEIGPTKKSEVLTYVNTISRTAWGAVIKENEVEAIIKTIPKIEYVDGKYILRKKGIAG